MTIIDFIGYGILAPMPLWALLYVGYLMWADMEYGPPCKKCKDRHRIYHHCDKEKAKKPFWAIILILGMGGLIIFIVQFTSY